jgi:hypothetical protein
MDIEGVKDCLVYIALSDHMGDVNDIIPELCKALNLEQPEWSYKFNRFIFPWEEKEN